MKLIKNWEELSKVPANDKYRIIVKCDEYWGWIVPVDDEPGDNNFICNCDKKIYYDRDYWEDHVYLSTHTFYGSQYRESTKILQKYGF